MVARKPQGFIVQLLHTPSSANCEELAGLADAWCTVGPVHKTQELAAIDVANRQQYSRDRGLREYKYRVVPNGTGWN